MFKSRVNQKAPDTFLYYVVKFYFRGMMKSQDVVKLPWEQQNVSVTQNAYVAL